MFLAPFHLLGAFALQGALVAQHLLIMATSLLAAGIAGRVTGGSRPALAAYILSTLGLARDWHANLVLSETLFTFLLLLAVALLVLYLDRRSVWAAVGLGSVIGLATLVRPIATYLWVPMTMVLFAACFCGRPAAERQWWRAAAHAGVLVASFYLVLSPWLLRNQYLFGSPFMTRFLGRNLWVVTFEPQSGSGLTLGDGPASRELLQHLAPVEDSVVIRDTWSVSDALTAAGLDDHEVDALMLRVCRELIAESRPRVAYKTIRRAVNFWRCVSNPFPFYEWRATPLGYDGQVVWKSDTATRLYRAANQYAASRSLRFNEIAIVSTILALMILLFRSRTAPLALGLGLVLLYFDAVTATLEIPSYRYRMILEPLMVVSCVAGGSLLFSRGRRTGRGECAGSTTESGTT